VVGMATLALLVGPIAGRKIYLDDFVTDPSVQGKGVGSRLWDAMLSWGQQHGAAKLTFTSNPKRQAAHRFYLHKGATIYNTTVFEKTIEQKSEL
jgi:acetyltransferase, GNAT family